MCGGCAYDVKVQCVGVVAARAGGYACRCVGAQTWRACRVWRAHSFHGYIPPGGPFHHGAPSEGRGRGFTRARAQCGGTMNLWGGEIAA